MSVDSYNLTTRDTSGAAFIGDRASETGFFAILDRLRRRERTAADPFGPQRGPKTDKTRIDHVMLGGDPDGAHLVHLAIEEYAGHLVDVVRFFLAQPGWEDVERIVIGGGFHEKRFGAFAIRRTARLLRSARVPVALHVLEHDADEGGLIGWVHAVAPETTRAFDAFLAVDIGGTHVRCGIVEHRLRRAADGSRACVLDRMQWRHKDDAPSREELVTRIAGMLNGLAAQARTLGVSLAPVVGIACPGQIEPDGGLAHGTQNLPGDWDTPFNLPRELGRQLDRIGGRAPQVLMHNDAVIQGLSERPKMKDVRRWAVLTIGTGLGNASYTNR
ncbi:MAG TPA: ROK family protein [Lysobacter sp.]